jgi:signal transduction histidine kinase/ActR/RegA family two-component response regulator
MTTMDNAAAHQDLAFDPLVAAEQVRMIYHQLPVSVSGTMIGVLLLAAVLWPVVSHGAVLAWALAMAANQIWRLGLYLRFRKSGIPEGEHERWGRYWMIGSGISGCIWGMAALMFFIPGSDLYQTILIISIFAITSVAVPLIASHAPSFFVFVFPTLLPIIGINVWQGDALHLIIGFITFCVMLGVLAVGIKYNRLLSASLRNRFRNEALVAELQKRNAELDRARQMAEQLSLAKSQFFAAASHDLRQPLHAMGLFAAALSEKVRDPGVSNVVNSIGASVEALETLFNELLDLSKIDAGAVKPELTDFDIQGLLDRLAMDFEPEAFDRGLRLRIHAFHQHVRSDPLLLERILRNLITNALRYTRSGGVLVGCRRRGRSLLVEVWDTGIGIPLDQQQRIFDEFVQIGNPERDRRKGLGLGLSIVKRLSTLLQHPLELKSRIGLGSMFRLALPLSERPAASPPRPTRSALPLQDFSNRRILVVDDEQPVLDGMSALLQGWGAQVIARPSTREALDALPPGAALDLVIADYQLRDGEDGTETIRAVRARCGQGVPAIMITGSTTPERVAEAKAGGFHLLLKPVMPAKLRTLINFKLRQPDAASPRG